MVILMGKIGLNEMVEDDEKDDGIDDSEEDVDDWSNFYGSLDDEEIENYLDVLMKEGEGELRDRLVRDHGIISDPQPFINDLRKDLMERSDDADEDMIRKGGSFEERAVNGEDDVLGLFDEEEDEDSGDVEEDLVEEDDDEDDPVAEYIEVLRDDLGTIPKKSVQKELDADQYDRLISHEFVEADDFNVKWVGD